MSSTGQSDPLTFDSREGDADVSFQTNTSLVFQPYSAHAYQSIDAFTANQRVAQTPVKPSIDDAELARRKFKLATGLVSLMFLIVVICLALFVPRNVDATVVEFRTSVNNLPGNVLSGSVIVDVKNNNFVPARIKPQQVAISFNGSILKEIEGTDYTIPENDSEKIEIPPMTAPLVIRDPAFSNYALSECNSGDAAGTFSFDVVVSIPVEILSYKRTYIVAETLHIPCGRVIIDPPQNPTLSSRPVTRPATRNPPRDTQTPQSTKSQAPIRPTE